MDIRFFEDIRLFARRVEPLARRDALRNTMLLEILRQGLEAGSEDFLMATAEEDGTLRMVVLGRPSFPLTACTPDDGSWHPAVDRMGTALAERCGEIPGVLGEAEPCRKLAESYAAALEKRTELARSTTLMALNRVNFQPDLPGRLRPARVEDLYFLPHWHTAFQRDCGHRVETLASAELTVRDKLCKGRLFLWEEGTPKAMAAVCRVQEKGVFLSSVYTPPALRGQGWGTACVSALCQRLLAEGHSACCLYVDNANPVSTHMYRKIGFASLCDSAEYQILDMKPGGKKKPGF